MHQPRTTIVTIDGEGYGTRVGVGLGRIATERYESEYYSLDKLLLIRQRELALNVADGAPNNDQQHQLRHYARALLAHGADILRDDFTIWPWLRKTAWPRKRVAKNRRAR